MDWCCGYGDFVNINDFIFKVKDFRRNAWRSQILFVYWWYNNNKNKDHVKFKF